VSHVKAARTYARHVIDGTIPACKWIKLAAQRFERDEIASKIGTFEYVLNEDRAEQVCAIIELLPHTKGKWAAKKELIKLSNWQSFFFVNLFGWVHKKTGLRRFGNVYAAVPRKNGKSVIGAALGLIGFCFDGEFGPEVYSGATTEKQAWEVFRPARLMVKNSPDLIKLTGIEVLAKSLFRDSDHGRFEPLIGKPGDGASPHVAVIDEYHEHDSDHMVDAMQTGMGAREQPILAKITTAGTNVASPCYAEQKRCELILEGALEDEQTFALIYTIDEGDDWADPKSLIKANPNYGVSIYPDFLAGQLKQALQSAAKQNAFKTKHLNIWCFANSALFNLEEVKRGKDDLMVMDEFIGLECWQSADLASKLDLCAESVVFKKRLADGEHFYMFSRYWLPEEQAENSVNQEMYEKWAKQGHLHLTPGASIDFDLIDAQMIERAKQISPKAFIFDPHNATRLGQRMMDEGFEAVEFNQMPQNFTVPLDNLQAALANGRFHWDGNPITLWCFGNVVGRNARKGLMAPTKQFPHQKIDGAIAAIMGISRAVDMPIDQPSVYEQRGALLL
jgi:phage terminase large subunit-like protein